MVPEVPSRRLVLGGALAAGAVPALGAAAPASATDTGTRPTVVLAHGVFADASGWGAVTASLLDAGYQVIAPANPLRDLAGDSAYVSSVIDTLTGPVILVGHSYGGEVITNAGRGHAQVKALVYVAAFAPDEGESALQLAGKFPGSQLEPALVGRPYPIPGSTEPGVDGYIDPAKFHDVFAQDLPRSRTFVAGEKDHLMPPKVQESNARHYRSDTVTEVREFPGRPHLLPAAPGWEEVADFALDWALAHTP